MSCKQATDMMSQGLDRDLSWGERLGLRLHLLICIGCRRTRAQFAFLRQAVQRYTRF
ncbi:MAG TPA: zf-HC2 domain-containing protein [Rhodocyclaceae bacterium]